jgi:hypothetical protein
MTTAVGGAKKKLNRADFMFNQVTGQTLVKKPGDIDGVQFAIRYLTDCHASVFDYTGQVSKTSKQTQVQTLRESPTQSKYLLKSLRSPTNSLN